MFDPTEFICGNRYCHIVRYCSRDWLQGSPMRERLNPLRYEVGIGKRPGRVVINRSGRAAIKFANFIYRLKQRTTR